MKAREIILLVLIIAGGIILTQEKTGKVWPEWAVGDFLIFDGRAFTFQESQVLEAPLPATLRLMNAHGEVTVEGTETDRVTLTLEKIVRRHTESEAKSVADGLHAVVNRDSLAVVITTNRADLRERGLDTNFRLTVPAGMALQVDNSYGMVKVRGVAAATVVNRHGEVNASNITGALKVENAYEDVSVDGIRGACEIKSSHSDVLARGVEGGLTLDHAYGTVTLSKIAQTVVVEAPHSEVLAEDIAGPLDIRNSYEKVTLRRVGPANVTGHHSEVEAAEVKGDLEVATSYATVSVSAVQGGLRVTGKSVGLSGNGVSGGEIYVATSYEPVELSGFSGKTTIVVSHGDVVLTPLPLTGPIDVRGDYSGITLHWPAGGPYPIEARTKSGEIGWHLAEPVPVEEKEGFREVKAFSGLQDKPAILLVTSYDDIEVEGGGD
jgi:hypothetical protein